MHLPCQQGVEQDAASQLSGAEGHSAADKIGALQHRASACVDNLGAIMVLGDPAVTAQSTILPALKRLFASLQGLFTDGGIDCKARPFLTARCMLKAKTAGLLCK